MTNEWGSCLNCQTLRTEDYQDCPECGCPFTNEEFNDPTGEEQDRVLRWWHERFMDDRLDEWYGSDDV